MMVQHVIHLPDGTEIRRPMRFLTLAEARYIRLYEQKAKGRAA